MQGGSTAAGAASRRRRTGAARASGAQLLGTLPHEVLLHTLALAAYPLEEWAWPMHELAELLQGAAGTAEAQCGS